MYVHFKFLSFSKEDSFLRSKCSAGLEFQADSAESTEVCRITAE